jgi:hypothetical protein
MPNQRHKQSGNGRNGKSPRRGTARTLRRSTSSDPESLVALAESGRLGDAARAEVRAQRAAGLPITYKRGNQVVTEHPDGRCEVLETLRPPPPFKIPKGVGRIRNGNGTNDRG